MPASPRDEFSRLLYGGCKRSTEPILAVHTARRASTADRQLLAAPTLMPRALGTRDGLSRGHCAPGARRGSQRDTRLLDPWGQLRKRQGGRGGTAVKGLLSSECGAARPRAGHIGGSRRVSGPHSCAPWMGWGSRHRGRASQGGGVSSLTKKRSESKREAKSRLGSAVGMTCRWLGPGDRPVTRVPGPSLGVAAAAG